MLNPNSNLNFLNVYHPYLLMLEMPVQVGLIIYNCFFHRILKFKQKNDRNKSMQNLKIHTNYYIHQKISRRLKRIDLVSRFPRGETISLLKRNLVKH